MPDPSACLGRIVAISANNLSCRLDGSGPKVGALVKARTDTASTVYGVVNRLELAVDGGAMAVIDLLGEVADPPSGALPSFQRGVSILPVLGTQLHLAGDGDYTVVYAKPTRFSVRVGTLCQAPDRPAYLMTDDLLGKHFAVLGTTGSGKSCAVALTLRAILEAHPHGHVVMLDPHNEYAQAFPDMGEVLDITTIQMPLWLLDFEESVGVLVRGGTAHEQESQSAILKEAILQAKRKYAGEGAESGYITVDTPVPYRVGDLIRIIDAGMGRLDKPDNSAPYLRLKMRLESLSSDRRFAFMFSGTIVRDNLAHLLSRILRIPSHGKPLTIIDLSGVPSEIVDVLVSMLSRITFDFALWGERGSVPPVLLVCEEAHRYIPKDESGFGSTKRALSRIAKEGRKYGVSLCLVSQRPAELSPGILSQCGTLFALRMGNDQDQGFVRAALPENARGMLDALPALRRQEAIVVGEGITVPVRLRFDDLAPEHQPRSAGAVFSRAWQEEAGSAKMIEESVRRWRMQVRRATEDA
ncbi:MAG: DUF87 domain-containing protein [Rhodospirillales bacterium]|nr:DUF87 domain-containing protein [Rhodospirillales bacterium]